MDGVILTPLMQIDNPKGDILHALKRSEIGFDGFGEAYFSSINKNITKGWKKHTNMILNLVVPVGEIEFVVYNEIKDDFLNIKLSMKNYQRLTIHPNLWLAFRGVDEYNLLLNIANIEHDPYESINKKLENIPYEW